MTKKGKQQKIKIDTPKKEELEEVKERFRAYRRGLREEQKEAQGGSLPFTSKDTAVGTDKTKYSRKRLPKINRDEY